MWHKLGWREGEDVTQGPLPGVMPLGIFHLTSPLPLRLQGSRIGSLQGKYGICVLGSPRSPPLGSVLCCLYPVTAQEVLLTLIPIPSVHLSLSVCLSVHTQMEPRASPMLGLISSTTTSPTLKSKLHRWSMESQN